jgi:hypothetical protein
VPEGRKSRIRGQIRRRSLKAGKIYKKRRGPELGPRLFDVLHIPPKESLNKPGTTLDFPPELQQAYARFNQEFGNGDLTPELP